MEELVISLEDVKKNIIQFNRDLEENTDIISQLTQFIHWYYIPTIDAFGPSKYIGYKNMDTEKYARGENKTGVDTEKIMKEWFVKLSPESSKSQELMSKLESQFDLYGKKVKRNARIHILKKGINLS
ncbi:hypothetical protein [Bacillus testis]|uniref:hypothetical protein n=1 Tax=Bacillus testis TaxID=1622072 RepID=UPI00067EBF41|nr:hypothetical protein [Bacillus testis]